MFWEVAPVVTVAAVLSVTRTVVAVLVTESSVSVTKTVVQTTSSCVSVTVARFSRGEAMTVAARAEATRWEEKRILICWKCREGMRVKGCD